jgi:hypothetical protein
MLFEIINPGVVVIHNIISFLFIILTGFYSSSSGKLTNAELRKKRNAIFEEEKAKQLSFIKRLEKISVKYSGHPEIREGEGNVELLMNKHVSTPYNCAMRK